MDYGSLLSLLLKTGGGILNPSSLASGFLTSLVPGGFLLPAIGGLMSWAKGPPESLAVNMLLAPQLERITADDEHEGYVPLDDSGDWVHFRLKLSPEYMPTEGATGEYYYIRFNKENGRLEYLVTKSGEGDATEWRPLNYVLDRYGDENPIEKEEATLVVPDALYSAIYEDMVKNGEAEEWPYEEVPEPPQYQWIGQDTPVEIPEYAVLTIDPETGQIVSGAVPYYDAGQSSTSASVTSSGGGSGGKPMADTTTTMTSSTSMPDWLAPIWDELLQLILGGEDQESWAETLQRLRDTLMGYYENLAGEYGEVREVLRQKMQQMANQPPVNITFGGKYLGQWVPYSKTLGNYGSILGGLLSGSASLGAPYAAAASLPQMSLLSTVSPFISALPKTVTYTGELPEPSPIQQATGVMNLLGGGLALAGAGKELWDMFSTPSALANTASAAAQASMPVNYYYSAANQWLNPGTDLLDLYSSLFQ